MEFLKILTSHNVLPFLIIILMLFLVFLSIYGLRTCCRSKSAILEISDQQCHNDNFGEEGYIWSNPLTEQSAKTDAFSDAKTRNDCLHGGVTCELLKNGSKFISTEDLKFSKTCEDVSHKTPFRSWKNIRHLRDARPFRWTDRWFCRKKQANSKFSIGENLYDLEESSLDLLICKLDSLVLTFKSSDASRSSATSLSSFTVDNAMAESEKCLSLATIN